MAMEAIGAVSFRGGSGDGAYRGTMNLLRKLAWTALLLTSGLGASDAPRDRGDGSPEAGDLPPAWPWLLEDEDDDFEGEGWSFWPLERWKR